MLASCSTSEKVRYQPIKPNPIICPKKVDCQTPEINIKTNGDLVKVLDKSLNTIEVCQIIIESLEHCIEQYNHINKGE
ncbi:Rz1-like lysis system protein LysC [Mannheimia granulomatis]|uniref:Rz1-like lysis system protein LysC n=1 Tax=Mannheimia granulomatis TaxID=85402 RepID=UPI0009B84FF0|nr:Rz1-like lysis system protein LysC [Mannheimia granulomatis]